MNYLKRLTLLTCLLIAGLSSPALFAAPTCNTTEQQIVLQQAYIALLGRPQYPEEFKRNTRFAKVSTRCEIYWIINRLPTTDEYKANNANLDISSLLSGVYARLFGVPLARLEKTYYQGLLKERPTNIGRITIHMIESTPALFYHDSPQVKILRDKLSAATYFTERAEQLNISYNPAYNKQLQSMFTAANFDLNKVKASIDAILSDNGGGDNGGGDNGGGDNGGGDNGGGDNGGGDNGGGDNGGGDNGGGDNGGGDNGGGDNGGGDNGGGDNGGGDNGGGDNGGGDNGGGDNGGGDNGGGDNGGGGDAVSARPTGLLNDTGVITCTLGSLSAGCSGQGQDGDFGRDVSNSLNNDGILGFSFTKVSSTGKALPANASQWSCVKDNVTGLIWETKRAAGLHSSSDTFTWYDTNPATNRGYLGIESPLSNHCSGYQSGNEASYCNTEAFVNRVNKKKLCGIDNWRMPSIKELESLVYFGKQSPPLIEASYFPQTAIATYWSGTATAFHTRKAWYTSFSYGGSDHNERGTARHIRLVYDGQ